MSSLKKIVAQLASKTNVAIDVATADTNPMIESLCESLIRYDFQVPIYWWDLAMGFQHVLLEPGVGISLYTSSQIAKIEARRAEERKPRFYTAKTIQNLLADQKLEWDEGITDKDALHALDFVRDCKDPGIFIFVDLHKIWDNPGAGALIQRSLKMALASLSERGKTRMLVMGQDITMPADLAGLISLTKIAPPNESQRLAEIQKWVVVLRRDRPGLTIPTANDPVWDRMVRASATLSFTQIGNVIREVVILDKSIGEATVEAFHAQKRENLLATGIQIAEIPDTELGGFGAFREWMEEQADYFNLNNPNVPAPKGAVLFGLPGTGKTHAALIAGKTLNVPVFMVTADLLLDGVVGGSEAKTAALIRALKAAAPGIVCFNEMEKLLSGMAAGGGDGGAGQRVFGMILRFLEENDAPLFFIATANKIHGMPPELTRQGRFDCIFWADLPNQTERKEILLVHLDRWGKAMTADVKDEIADTISLITGDFSGAELAEIVRRATRDAYSAGREGDIDLDDMRKRKTEIKPQSAARAIEFAATRLLAEGFTPASKRVAHCELPS